MKSNVIPIRWPYFLRNYTNIFAFSLGRKKGCLFRKWEIVFHRQPLAFVAYLPLENENILASFMEDNLKNGLYYGHRGCLLQTSTALTAKL